MAKELKRAAWAPTIKISATSPRISINMKKAKPPNFSSSSWRVKTKKTKRKRRKPRRARRTRRERKPRRARKVEKERARVATKAWKAPKAQRTCHQWAPPHPAPNAPSRVSGWPPTLMATTTSTLPNSAPLSTTAAWRTPTAHPRTPRWPRDGSTKSPEASPSPKTWGKLSCLKWAPRSSNPRTTPSSATWPMRLKLTSTVNAPEAPEVKDLLKFSSRSPRTPPRKERRERREERKAERKKRKKRRREERKKRKKRKRKKRRRRRRRSEHIVLAAWSRFHHLDLDSGSVSVK